MKRCFPSIAISGLFRSICELFTSWTDSKKSTHKLFIDFYFFLNRKWMCRRFNRHLCLIWFTNLLLVPLCLLTLSSFFLSSHLFVYCIFIYWSKYIPFSDGTEIDKLGNMHEFSVLIVYIHSIDKIFSNFRPHIFQYPNNKSKYRFEPTNSNTEHKYFHRT